MVGKPKRKAGKGKGENEKRMLKVTCFYFLSHELLASLVDIGVSPQTPLGRCPKPQSLPRKLEGTRSWENSWQEHVLVKNKSINTITSTEILLISKIKATVTNFKVKPTLTTLKSLKLVTGLLNVFESKQEHN